MRNALLILLLLVAPAQAARPVFHCPGGNVRIGDYVSTVQTLCGEPLDIGFTITHDGDDVIAYISRWGYAKVRLHLSREGFVERIENLR